MVPPLFNAVLIDIAAWLVCLSVLAAFARLSITHPATTYLVFHAVFVSARAIAILNGARTLFWWPGVVPVTHDEIARAVVVADVALAMMTCAWSTAAYRATKAKDQQPTSPAQPLRLGIIQAIAAVAIPIGCVAILLWSTLPGVGPYEIAGPWAASSWIVIAQTWAEWI